ncbi:hypothetical protein DMN91_012599 [Ooceraea biroi]|uniref:JmjC domain-containing protein n=1 Tax=Ooceraea biroi TaxID=2015173 RepID=A0A3L8D2I6_OOCBI|nr:HSPB1-associated protein 1 [Ooceraea biroi]RLU14712.1 hypothetical protein DMN91_012599 [Ooceraea biroi]
MEKLGLLEVLKDTLPTLPVPVLFKNMLRRPDGSYEWKLLQWDIYDLVNIFGDKQLPFRIGDHNKRTCATQHDQCSVEPPIKPIQMTFGQFVNKAYESFGNKWLYCDYKYMQEWFTDKPELIESFNWLKFGIGESMGKNGLHSTIWIGSKGAHTDCHRDTYGYNLVAQVYGRKLWLLYPPNNALIPVRIPYEESTVYSRFNIYCLSEEEQCYLMESVPVKPKLIVLEPGDVLFVPNGWWHYVESLDTVNISVNLWGKLETDARARVEEALVQLLISKLARTELQETDVNIDSYYYTRTVENAVIDYKEMEEKKNNERNLEETQEKSSRKRRRADIWTAKELAEEYPDHVELLKDARSDEYTKFLEERRERDTSIRNQGMTENINNAPQFDSFLEDLINALCHPDVINKAANILLERFS